MNSKPWNTIHTEITNNNSDRLDRIEHQKHSLALACNLHQLRKQRGITQKQLAQKLHTSQENISRIERTQELKLSTLERYIQQLGGKLEIHAIFNDQDINLTNS